MAVTKYEPAPPGARPGAKAAGIGAPSVFNPVVPPSAPGASGADMAGDFQLPTYDWSNVILGSGGSNIPRSYYDALGAARTSEADTAAQKLDLEYQKAQKDLEFKNLDLARKAAGAQSALEYYQSQLGNVAGGAIPETLATTLEDQRNQRTDFANTTYNNLLNRLGTAYTQAGNLTNEGFANLQAYLQGAPQNAFATAERATAAPAVNDLAQYMASRGVETGRAEPGLQAATAAAQGGAANYNNLLTVLAANATQANQSRQNEQMMAQRFAQAQLTAQKAAQEGSLSQAQLNQLNVIQDQYNASKLQLQRDSIARENALQDAIAALQSSGYLSLGGGTDTGTVTDTSAGTTPPPAAPTTKTPLEQLASMVKPTNTALTKRVEAFAAKNPNATAAIIAKQFPALGKKIK